MSEQPAVAYFCESLKANFPFLLFFGREYNNESGNQVINSLGPYCFRESPYSTFWNKAYGLIGRTCGLPDFKKICIRQKKSPVLFSNMLPRPIPSSTSRNEKRQIRLSIPDETIRRYIEDIFKMQVINRVRLMIFSDIGEPEFERATRLIAKECKQRRIEVSALPYLGSRRLKKEEIDCSLSDVARSIIFRTVAAFYDEMGIHTNWQLSEAGAPCG